MTIAIIRTGGKQYKVSQGDVVKIEKIEGEKDKQVSFQDVLFVGDKEEVAVGTPLVKGAKVEGKIVEQFKDKKVTAIKHKAKKRQLKKLGHRQMLTKVEITRIAKQ